VKKTQTKKGGVVDGDGLKGIKQIFSRRTAVDDGHEQAREANFSGKGDRAAYARQKKVAFASGTKVH